MHRRIAPDTAVGSCGARIRCPYCPAQSCHVIELVVAGSGMGGVWEASEQFPH